MSHLELLGGGGGEGKEGPEGKEGKEGKTALARETKAYEVEGAITAKTFLPWIMPKPATGETVKFVGIIFKLAKGTCKLEVKRNGTLVTGYKAAELEATTAASKKYGTAVELAEGDELTVTVSEPSTAEGLTAELVLEHV